MKTRTVSPPVCKCGSRDFEPLFGGRNELGRTEFRLLCRTCRKPLLVDKTAFALFRYIHRNAPSRDFLKLFDLI